MNSAIVAFLIFCRDHLLVVQDPDLIRKILVKDFEYFVNRAPSKMHDYFPRGTRTRSEDIWLSQMTNATGEEWKDLRATFSPIFTSGQ